MVDIRFIVSLIAAFAAIWVFQFFYHGILLLPTYEATSTVWRSIEVMGEFYPWVLVQQFALAFVLTWIFAQNYEGEGLVEGVRFGVFAGLIMGVIQFGSYPYLPIPIELALAWLVGGLGMGICVGVILSFTYRHRGAA